MQAIELSYRGYGIKVTPDSNGWTNYLRFPHWKPEEFIKLDQYDFASDAVHASMCWIEWQSTNSIIREVLQEEVDSDRLSLTEFTHLSRSAVQEGWKKRVPARVSVES
ncbi:hypothetical protein NDA01_23920 [Trichocoleus desertorum AS-A10]|uniref:hypothetical protein n=1 Tax=Trichocoleus desertorum TaxID=1481672 RepID=UPI003297DA15